MSAIIIVVVFFVKELNERFKAKLPVPLPIEVAIVSILPLSLDAPRYSYICFVIDPICGFHLN